MVSVCDNPMAKGSKIRVMPDVHPGKIGPIGLTMTVTDTVLPGHEMENYRYPDLHS